MEVRSLHGVPILADFHGSGGTPLVIDQDNCIPYYLDSSDNIIDLRTGAVIGTGVEEDLRFPATLLRQGALTKPDFDYTNVGLLFPQNDPAEVAFIIGQLPHAAALHPRTYLAGTSIIPHIHYRQTGSSVPVFKLDYKWFNNGEAEPASFTTITTTGVKFTYTSGNFAQMLMFPAIDGTGKHTSSNLVMKLYRDDNVVTGDVLVREFDIHYLAFSQGTIRS